MGGGSSYDANDRVIKQTWAIMASRKDSTGLFFARPYYSKDILAGDVSKARQSVATIMGNIDEQTQLGDVGTLTWADPAVVAANRFRNFFVGQSEKLGSSGHTAYNMRGKTGIVIVRGEGPGAVSLSVGMTDGTYYDQVTGEKFTVSGGVVKGTVKNADGIAVVYNPAKDYGKVTPVEPTVIRINAEAENGSSVFTSDSTNVKITVSGATTATYTTSEGKSGTITGTKTLNVGKFTATGATVQITVTGTKDGITKTKTYNFTKKVISSEYPSLSKGGIVFDNSAYNWAKVYCYVYDESGASVINNAAWPGELMSEEQNDYWTYEFPSKFTGNVNVIFNNGSGVQYPTGTGLAQSSSAKKLFKDQKLIDLPASVKSLTVGLKSSVTTAAIGQQVTLTATTANSSGTVYYTFLCNDGNTVKATSTSNTCTWTPTKAGTYIISVRANDNNLSVTDVVTIKVSASSKLVSNASVSAAVINKGESVTLNGAAVGGKAPYQFAYFYKKAESSAYIRLKDYSTAVSAVFKPATNGNYDLRIKTKDSAGTVAASTFSLKVNPATAALTNTSKASATAISLGGSVKLTASATGGTAPYQYAYFYKKSTASVYSKLKDYSTTSTCTFKPTGAYAYNLMVKVKDSKGTIAKKTFSLQVSADLTNQSTLSATSVKLGNTVTVNVSAAGGTAPYLYGVYYKKASFENWTTVQSYGSNTTVKIKPGAAVTYDICAKVKDSKGTIVKKYFTLKVTK